MNDCEKLVEALRDIEKTMFALGTSPTNMNNVSINLAYDKRWGRTAADAADVIEALQAQLPKLGKVVRCRECRWGTMCVTGQHLGLDGFCSKGKREVQE